MILTLLRHSAAFLPVSPANPPIPSALPDASWLPRRIKLLRWGDNPSLVGTIRVGNVSLELLSVNAQEFGREVVDIDFEHSTLLGSPESQGPRPVAGSGAPRVIGGQGLFLEDIVWKPAGIAGAANYPDLSPAVSLDSHGEVVFLDSVALTRAGAVYGLGFPEGTRPPGVCLAERAAWTRLSSTGSNLFRLAPALPISHPSL